MAVLLVASLLPLLLTGGGSLAVFERLLDERTLELHGAVIRGHAVTIQAHFSERLRALELAAATHGLDQLADQALLARLLQDLNATHEGAFVDLGVIGSNGRHLAYVGPHDLHGRDYSGAEWFRYVIQRGSYVSDAFLGFRRVPHCVMAVRREEGGRRWVLRATLDSDRLDSLVRTGRLGRTGEAFLVNEEGVYQIAPRGERVLDRSAIAVPSRHEGVHHLWTEGAGSGRQLQTTAWLREPRWMLVVQQDEAEVREPIREAMLPVVLVIVIAGAVVVLVTVLSTRHLTARIAEADRQRSDLSRDLLRSARLASLGEMSTGLAHEINNPLGIISAEKTNISDLVGAATERTAEHEEILDSLARIGRQVDRCAAITGKMLRFGRHGGGEVEATDVRPRLKEIVAMLDRQARIRNVELGLALADDLPLVTLDPTELEQVVINLVNNSIQAIERSGTVTLSAARVGAEVHITVEDDGPGIAPENLDRVFQPFFTTKPVGKGTGLGLSVCYGMVAGWGGRIEADSEPGRGTRMVIRVPIATQHQTARR